MNIEVTLNQAREIVRTQLREYVEKVEAAEKLFNSGKHQEAYRMFPYEHDVLDNFEKFVSEVASAK